MSNLEILLTGIQIALLLALAILGLHRGWMVLLYLRHSRRSLPGGEPRSELPRVTVQLPIYNERYVATRLIEQVAKLNYPRELLQIQVLDDSTDDSSEIVARTIRGLPVDLDIQHVRRQDRVGYKAGALAAGLKQASGDLLAIFDADFLPPADFLMRTVGAFEDPGIGMVQTRWDHLNPDYSLLTDVQATLLDGHFVIEHLARSRSGCFFNFNGTAGIFRRSCIEDAGGWQHDTLTEDMDLSYRAQLKGWRFRYLPEVACPAELPIEMNGFLSQQHRWAKGSIQTARKLLGKILRSSVGPFAKLEAVFHLLGNLAFPLLLGLILVALPLQVLRFLHASEVPDWMASAEGLPMLFATLCVFFYYGTAQRAVGRLRWSSVLRLPMVLAAGAGMAVNNTAAILSALRRETGEFR
ncbi:MAG: cellulose synthase family protein, partial [Planctomycetota bacterium]